MITHVLVAIFLLAAPAVGPTMALVGVRPVTLFLCPLAGSVLAAVAAEFELAIGGSLLTWFVLLAIVINAVTAPRLWKRARRSSADPFSSPWPWITISAVIVAVAWPLHALRNPIVISDGWAIWTLHSVFIYGGHGAYLSDLKNPAYRFSNPNYPPLVPASGALAFASQGRIDIRLAVIVTAVLSACGLGVLACGIIEAANRMSAVAKAAAVAAAAGICLIGMGTDSGLAALGGVADLTWAAAGAAGVVYGLMLPRSSRYLVIAWLCATLASLTKNEGLITALLIFLLIAVRYRLTLHGLVRHGISNPGSAPLAPAGSPSLSSTQSSGNKGRVFALFAAVPFAVLMATPCLVWALLMWLQTIRGNFIGRAPETVAQRVHPTLLAFADHLHILPVAAAVAVVGSFALRGARSRLGLGNPVWLWLVVAGSLAAIELTYLFGAPNIYWWLQTSVSRTTIFADLALYTDLAIWLVVALTGSGQTDGQTKPLASAKDMSIISATLIAENGSAIDRRTEVRP
jgi:hypothetical protein